MFTVVMFGVIGAFFVTNRQWNDVHCTSARERPVRSGGGEHQATRRTEQQKAELREGGPHDRARRADQPLGASRRDHQPGPCPHDDPRIELESKRLDRDPRHDQGQRRRQPDQEVRQEQEQEADDAPVILAPRYESTLAIVGVVPRNTDVARYLAALQRCELLRNVEMIQTEKTTIREREVFRFRIEAGLNPSSDASRIRTAPAAA